MSKSCEPYCTCQTDCADDLVDRFHRLSALYPGVSPSYLEDYENYEEETDHPATYREPLYWF